MKPLLTVILLFDLIPFSISFNQEIQDPISNSILSFIDQIAPWFETRYVKSDDGKDLKYTDFLISGIKSASTDQQQIKALTSFAMVIASLSKEDAKIYGSKFGKDEEIRKEYQSYLYLGTIQFPSENEKLQIYMHAIKSIAFHLKVKEIPIYENLELLNDYVENELSKNLQKLSQKNALVINQIHLHFLFSIALENYSKFLSIGILEDGQNPNFNRLAVRRSNILPQSKNVSELTNHLLEIDESSIKDIGTEMELLAAEYLSFSGQLMGRILESENK